MVCGDEQEMTSDQIAKCSKLRGDRQIEVSAGDTKLAKRMARATHAKTRKFLQYFYGRKLRKECDNQDSS